MNNEKNQTSSKKIQFKPLHEGMGFHPFSDGLPYAPASKTSASIPQKSQPNSQPQVSMNGTGAMAAGRPQFTTRTAPQYYQTKTTSLAAPEAIKPSMTSDHADEGLLTRKRIYAYTMDTVLHAGFWLITNLVALFAFDFQINLDLVKENFLQFLNRNKK